MSNNRVRGNYQPCLWLGNISIVRAQRGENLSCRGQDKTAVFQVGILLCLRQLSSPESLTPSYDTQGGCQFSSSRLCFSFQDYFPEEDAVHSEA